MSFSTKKKQVARERRHHRVRKLVRGTADRPRLAVFRSNKHITAQVIDDRSGRTLAAASSVEADLTVAVTDHHEGGEGEPPTTLDDLGDAVDPAYRPLFEIWH